MDESNAGSQPNVDPSAKKAQFLELPCKLTDGELRERGDALAVYQGRLEEIEQVKKEDAEHHNGRAKFVRHSMEHVAKELRDRQAMREVEVRELMCAEDSTVRTHRVDTGEMIRERPMNETERQRSLFAPVGDVAEPEG